MYVKDHFHVGERKLKFQEKELITQCSDGWKEVEIELELSLGSLLQKSASFILPHN